LLDQARRLGRDTRAGCFRRADCLERLGRTGEAAAERQRGVALQPADAVDYFLLGYEAYRRKEIAQAVTWFRTALHRRPDHFWAHYLAAVCYLSDDRPAEAEVSLSACEALRRGRGPDCEWVYILRGYACGVLGAADLRAGRAGSAALRFAAAEADF